MDLFDKNETGRHIADLAAKHNASIIGKAERPTAKVSSKSRQILLARLKAGSLSTVKAETIVHRGQATVCSLRERGHIIDTINGVYYYRRGPLVDPVSVSKTVQGMYYATQHWRRLAKERKAFDAWTCQQCKSKELLETHHWRYNLFCEDIRHDLITLCKPCHKNYHLSIKGSGVHFPRRLEPAMIERIKTS